MSNFPRWIIRSLGLVLVMLALTPLSAGAQQEFTASDPMAGVPSLPFSFPQSLNNQGDTILNNWTSNTQTFTPYLTRNGALLGLSSFQMKVVDFSDRDLVTGLTRTIVYLAGQYLVAPEGTLQFLPLNPPGTPYLMSKERGFIQGEKTNSDPNIHEGMLWNPDGTLARNILTAVKAFRPDMTNAQILQIVESPSDGQQLALLGRAWSGSLTSPFAFTYFVMRHPSGEIAFLRGLPFGASAITYTSIFLDSQNQVFLMGNQCSNCSSMSWNPRPFLLDLAASQAVRLSDYFPGKISFEGVVSFRAGGELVALGMTYTDPNDYRSGEAVRWKIVKNPATGRWEEQSVRLLREISSPSVNLHSFYNIAGQTGGMIASPANRQGCVLFRLIMSNGALRAHTYCPSH